MRAEPFDKRSGRRLSKRELVPFDRLRAQTRGTRAYASPNPNVPLWLTSTLLGARARGA
jgi:hypothetical protein